MKEITPEDVGLTQAEADLHGVISVGDGIVRALERLEKELAAGKDGAEWFELLFKSAGELAVLPVFKNCLARGHKYFEDKYK